MTAAMIGDIKGLGWTSQPSAASCYPSEMPLYEYECQDCRSHFELLVREQTVLACPSCHSADVEKQLSVFAVGGSSGGGLAARNPAPSACGSCGDPRGPGSCAIN